MLKSFSVRRLGIWGSLASILGLVALFLEKLVTGGVESFFHVASLVIIPTAVSLFFLYIKESRDVDRLNDTRKHLEGEINQQKENLLELNQQKEVAHKEVKEYREKSTNLEDRIKKKNERINDLNKRVAILEKQASDLKLKKDLLDKKIASANKSKRNSTKKQKIQKSEFQNLRDAICKHLHHIAHESRNTVFQLKNSNNQSTGGIAFLANVCNELKLACNLITGHECSVTIKLVIPSSGPDPQPDRAMRIAYCGGISTSRRENTVVPIQENTALRDIISTENSFNHYVSDNLAELADKGEFNSPTLNWRNHYNACLVVGLVGIQKDKTRKVLGMICVDNLLGGFAGNEFLVNILNGVADIAVIPLAECYERVLDQLQSR